MSPAAGDADRAPAGARPAVAFHRHGCAKAQALGVGGYEDQAPSKKELEEAAGGIRERLGFGEAPEQPLPLEEVEVRPARLNPPADLGDLFTAERYERVSRALGKSYRDVVRGFRGEFPNPPDLVALPRVESEIETALSWAEAEGAAVVPFGGGTSVVGGVEARLGDRPVICLDLRLMDRLLEVDPVSLAARIQAGATGPRVEGQLREHGLTLRHLPSVVRVPQARRLDRHPRGRSLRHALYPYRRSGRVRASDHPARGLAQPAPPRLRRRALARPGPGSARREYSA